MGADRQAVSKFAADLIEKRRNASSLFRASRNTRAIETPPENMTAYKKKDHEEFMYVLPSSATHMILHMHLLLLLLLNSIHHTLFITLAAQKSVRASKKMSLESFSSLNCKQARNLPNLKGKTSAKSAQKLFKCLGGLGVDAKVYSLIVHPFTC